MIGNRAVLILIIKFPKPRHDAERHIEFSVRPITDLPRRFENVAELGTYSNRMFSGSRIEPLNIAVFLPIAQKAFKPVEFAEDRFESCDNARFIVGPGRQPKLSPHRRPGWVDKSYPPGSGPGTDGRNEAGRNP